MNLELEKETLRCCRCVYAGEHAQEEAVEAVISDAMPDAAEIVEAQARLFLRSKESRAGRVQLRFAIEGSLLYRSEEEGRICALELKGDCPVDWEDEAMEEDVRLLVTGRLYRVEGRMINPRKLQLRCELIASVREWAETEIAVSTGCSAEKLELKIEKRIWPYVSAVGEKTFVLSEDLSFSEGAEELSALLLTGLELQTEESQIVAGKLLLRGEARLSLLYLNGDGTPAAPQSLKLPWSQLLDMGQECERCHVSLMPTALYADPFSDGQGVSVELHLTAQAVCFSERELSFVADAYSTACAAELSREELLAGEQAALAFREESLRESVPAESREETVLLTFCELGKRQKEGFPIRCRCLLRRGDGTLHTMEKELLWQGEQTPELCSCSAELSGGRLELRAALLSAEEAECEPLCFVSGIELSEEQRRGGEACTLYAVRDEGASMWELARKYGSTVSLIEQANASRAPGDVFLFVPRSR
ncbi:MAG: DUF3794 domain-containing protein [Oscillospiraceae bacterium]|nr:DUF3794 domain-containing protein [Oscillospiraceae bacterium]